METDIQLYTDMLALSHQKQAENRPNWWLLDPVQGRNYSWVEGAETTIGFTKRKVKLQP